VVTAPVSLLSAVSSSRDSFATYIAGAAEASRYEDSHDHEEGDNSLDRSEYVGHLALILSFLFKILRKLYYEKRRKELE
jgi:hypothetical protein